MKNAIIFTILAAAALSAWSCTHDTGMHDPGTDEANQVLVTLAVQVPGSKRPAATRALTRDEENAVAEIDILLFEPDGGRFVFRAGASESDISSNPDDSHIKTFTVKLRTGDYDMVLLANSRVTVAGLNPAGRTKAETLALLAVGLPEGGKWTAAKPFPMWGEVDGIKITEKTDLSGENRVLLTRVVARVNVQVAQDVQNFKMTSVGLYNYNTKGSLAPDPAAPTRPNVPSSSSTTKGPLTFSGDAIVGNGAVREIYLFESENHTDAAHTEDKAQAARTCIVVGGIWDANGDGNFENDGVATYYRIDFKTGSDTTPLFRDIVRNYSYIFNITKVGGPGYSTSEIAFNSAPVNIEAGVLEWNHTELQEIVFDDQNFLAVSNDNFTLSKLAQKATLTVCTDVPAGFTATVWDNVDGTGTTSRNWLKLSPGTGAGDDEPHDLTLSVIQNNGSNSRIAYIRITAGRLVYTVTVTQTSEVPLQITITGEDGKPVPQDLLEFATDGSDTKSFTVTWMPGNLRVLIGRVRTGVEDFSWDDPDNTVAILVGNGTATTPGSHTFQGITTTALGSDNIFYSKGSLWTFVIEDAEGAHTVSESITLFQGNKIEIGAVTLSAPSSIAFTYTGGNKQVNITSSATGTLPDGTAVSASAVAWTAEFSTDDGTTWQPSLPTGHWLEEFPMSGPGGMPQTMNVKFKAAPTTVVSAEDDALQAIATETGSPEARHDLSGGGETANCYVVNSPGYYKLPLYYGNTRDRNGQPYTGGIESNFTDGAGEPMTTDPITGAADAVVVWQGVPGLITNPAIDGAGFLTFDVAHSTIGQGNAVVAVRDTAGTVLWSWHIWVTPDYIWNAVSPATIAVTNRIVDTETPNQTTNYFTEYNLGWITRREVTWHSNPTVKIRITQTGITAAKSVVMTATQQGYTAMSKGVNPFWEWGRKDPMIPADGFAGDKPVEWWPGVAGKEGYVWTPYTAGNVSMAMAIRNPDVYYLYNSRTWMTPVIYNIWDADIPNASTSARASVAMADDVVVKTVYDPCPAGFKLPPINAFRGFTTTGLSATTARDINGVWNATRNGWDLYTDDTRIATIFFPLTGSRNWNIINTAYGYYNTAQPGPVSSYGYHFSFTSSTLLLSGNYYGLASSVRPIRDIVP